MTACAVLCAAFTAVGVWLLFVLSAVGADRGGLLLLALMTAYTAVLSLTFARAAVGEHRTRR